MKILRDVDILRRARVSTLLLYGDIYTDHLQCLVAVRSVLVVEVSDIEMLAAAYRREGGDGCRHRRTELHVGLLAD